MSTDDAAELRRLKILRNSERRLELLLGVKKDQESIDENYTTGNQPNNTADSEPEPIVHQRRHSNEVRRTSVTAETNTEPLLVPQSISKNQKASTPDTGCQFTGYSNLEFAIISSLALITSLLFFLDRSDLIFQNALLPFFTFELAHLIMHYNSLPSTSSSHVASYINLLKLFGIRQISAKKLITTANFFFILIDNFVIYLFCFILSSIVIHAVNLVLF